MSKTHRDPASEDLLRALEEAGLLDAGALAFLLRQQSHPDTASENSGVKTGIPPAEESKVLEFAALRTFLRAMALALGACPECWGQRPSCSLCRGQGRPGLFLPEPRHFEALVRPALVARLRADEMENRPDETVRAGRSGDGNVT